MSDDRADVPVVRLGDLLADSCYGTSEPSVVGGSTPVVGIPHVRDGRVRLTDLPRIDVPDAERAKLALHAGDLLLTRTNSHELVGQTGLVEEDSEAVFASYLVRLRVNADRVDPRYLNCWMNGPAGRRQIRRIITRAVGQANVNPTALRSSVRVPLPAMDEQRRVVNILATWDAAIESTRRLVDLRQAQMMQAACAQLAQADGRLVRVGELCCVSKGSGLSKGELANTGAHACILYGELHTVYGETIEDVRSRTDALVPSRSKYGDVLIPSSSETAEDLAKASALHADDVLLGGDINVLRARESGVYEPDFLAFYLTHISRKDIARLAQGQSVVHLYGRDIARLEVALPPLDMQRLVVSALRTAASEIAALQGLADRHLLQRRALENILLDRVDHSVEPATAR